MKYLNLNLEAFDYRKDGDETFRVRVSNSPAGEQLLSEAERVRLPGDLRTQLKDLEEARLSLPEVIAIGEKLGAVLFPPQVRSLLSLSRARLMDEEGLRIRLILDTYALANLPWEFAYLADPNTPETQKGTEGFLALDRRVSLVRYHALRHPLGKLEPVSAKRLRLVALLSNPKGTEGLDLKREQNNIEKALKNVTAVQPEFYPDATIDAMQEALIKGAHIFHYSGHGKFEGDMNSSYGSEEGKGFLSLTGQFGEEVPLSAQNLALSLSGRGVRFAMLGACESGKTDQVNAWTGIASALTRAGIPAVVGMQFAVEDENAIAFSRSLYHSLAAGQTVDEAVTEGRLAILLRSDVDGVDWGMPVLYLRAEEGVIFPAPAEAVAREERPSAVQPTAPEAPKSEGHLEPAEPASSGVEVDKRTLREAMVKSFTIANLTVLCSDIQEDLRKDDIDLEVNLDMVGGEGKQTKVLNLIQYLDRRGYLPYLVTAVRRERSNLI